jgi:hypothetical protein
MSGSFAPRIGADRKSLAESSVFRSLSVLRHLRPKWLDAMKSCRPPLFRKRKFELEVIVTCVRWYLRFCLSLLDLEKLMAERGLTVDHTTIWRWTQAYATGKHRGPARTEGGRCSAPIFAMSESAAYCQAFLSKVPCPKLALGILWVSKIQPRRGNLWVI